MKSTSHFTALITYLSSEKSGRTTPAASGYRAAVKFPFDKGLFTCIQKFTETDLAFPGDTLTAEMTLLNTEYFKGKIYAGLDFEFFEGPVFIGYGVVTGLTGIR